MRVVFLRRGDMRSLFWFPVQVMSVFLFLFLLLTTGLIYVKGGSLLDRCSVSPSARISQGMTTPLYPGHELKSEPFDATYLHQGVLFHEVQFSFEPLQAPSFAALPQLPSIMFSLSPHGPNDSASTASATSTPDRTTSERASATTALTSRNTNAPNNGKRCTSGLGVKVHWTWVNQETGLVQWRFQNPTSLDRATVLNRGIQSSSSYCFGNSFWPAYLETGLAHILVGPYGQLLSKQGQNVPLAMIALSSPGVCFVFTLGAGGTYEILEAGYVNAEPYCHELVDVAFAGNHEYTIHYDVQSQCHGFDDTLACPPVPFVRSWPQYVPVDGSMSREFGPQGGDIISRGRFLHVIPREKHDSSKTCFPGTARVQLRDGGLRAMRELRVGDIVATSSANQAAGSSTDDIQWTEVYAFADVQQNTPGIEYVRLVTDAKDHALEMTADHLVWATRRPGKRGAFVAARTVAVGTYLRRSPQGLVRVVRVERVQRNGAYGPLTRSGTLLVDGHLVSCYANIKSHSVAHNVFLPLRVYHRVFSLHAKHQPTTLVPGLHPYAKCLIMIRLVVLKIWQKPIFKHLFSLPYRLDGTKLAIAK